MAGLIGKKIGMTRIFSDEGAAVSVTVVEAGPCPVLQIKSTETDGYAAVQLGFGAQKDKRANKSEKGHAAKAGVEVAPRVVREFELSEGDEYELGQAITVDVFEVGFAGRPASHGHPMSRIPGSIGPGTDPSRVIKGKKLPGRMGGVRATLPNVKVVRVDLERNLLFVKGGVPGSRNSYLMIQK